MSAAFFYETMSFFCQKEALACSAEEMQKLEGLAILYLTKSKEFNRAMPTTKRQENGER